MPKIITKQIGDLQKKSTFTAVKANIYASEPNAFAITVGIREHWELIDQNNQVLESGDAEFNPSLQVARVEGEALADALQSALCLMEEQFAASRQSATS